MLASELSRDILSVPCSDDLVPPPLPFIPHWSGGFLALGVGAQRPLLSVGGNLYKVFTVETRGGRVALSQAGVLTGDLGRKREGSLDV